MRIIIGLLLIGLASVFSKTDLTYLTIILRILGALIFFSHFFRKK